MTSSYDAVVIGAGPNGLTAANLLADSGWSVRLLEANPEPGGAVRTGELTLPGFRHDLFSAFYPLAVAAPVLQRLRLDQYGLRWCRSEVALANPTLDGRCARICSDIDDTAASLDEYHPGDGAAWRDLFDQWERWREPLLDALFTPIPPIGAGARLLRAIGLRRLGEAARFALLPVRRMAEENFGGEGGGLLLAGNALHSDIGPDNNGSGIFGWLLSCLAQDVGYPVPEGGAGALTRALVARLESSGGELTCGQRVTSVVVEDGRAAGVITEHDERIEATRAVLADVDAPTLYGRLVGEEHLPERFRRRLNAFQWDASTVKFDWALSGPVPWSADGAAAAGTVHLAESLDHLTTWMAQLACRQIPSAPFVLFGQQSVLDPSRAPSGSATAWAYTHVPREVRGDAGDAAISGDWTERDVERFAERVERQIERFAPGFRSLILARHVMSPAAMEAANSNLVGGAINGGTAQIHQQLIFRPVPGFGRANTPVRGLFLASASAHPGGGVHGGAGALAARAAQRTPRLPKVLRR